MSDGGSDETPTRKRVGEKCDSPSETEIFAHTDTARSESVTMPRADRTMGEPRTTSWAKHGCRKGLSESLLAKAAPSTDAMPTPHIALVVVSRHLLKRIFGSPHPGIFGFANAKATIYKNEFAIIEVAGAGSAIIDLKPTSLVCAAFELTCQQALARLAEPGGVDEFRTYIARHPKLLPLR